MTPDAILLLAHGTPDVLGEMAEYLSKVTSGRALPDEVVKELQHRYAEIGLRDEPLPEGPPLTRWTLEQGRLLNEALGQKVYVGMRNWRPFIADVLERDARRWRQAPPCHLPRPAKLPHQHGPLQARHHRCSLGHGDGIRRRLERPSAARTGLRRKLQPVWAEACAATGTRVPVLFTAHSVPCRTIMYSPSGSPSGRPAAPPPADGIQQYDDRNVPDPYPVECQAHRHGSVAKAVGLTDKDWFFSFQSQGIAGAPWIGPTVEDTLKALAAEGHKGVVMQPVGFLCDHVEILYDIDIAFKKTARELGMQLWRAGSLNDSPTLIRALAEIARGEWSAEVDEVVSIP